MCNELVPENNGIFVNDLLRSKNAHYQSPLLIQHAIKPLTLNLVSVCSHYTPNFPKNVTVAFKAFGVYFNTLLFLKCHHALLFVCFFKGLFILFFLFIWFIFIIEILRHLMNIRNLLGFFSFSFKQFIVSSDVHSWFGDWIGLQHGCQSLMSLP